MTEQFAMKKIPKVNDRLHHQVLGKGRVTAVSGPHPHGESCTMVTVNFDEHGEKELIWAFCVGKVRKLRSPHGRHIDGRGRK